MHDVTDLAAIAPRVRAETFVRYIERHEEIGSTNDRALALAAADAALPTPTLVLADRQTTGRGRGSHVWRSGPGALTFSLLIERPAELPRDRMPILSLAAGLAARDAVAAAAPGHVAKVKWPNDVYLDGRKVCGILTEVPSGTADRAIVGVGLNLNNSLADAPEEVRQRAVSVREATGVTADPGDALIGFLARFEAELAELAQAGRITTRRWSPHCLLTGRDVRLRTLAGESAGLCLGISEDGALLLEGPTGPRPFHAGEVVAF